jgi:hypothetical protein
MKSATHAYVQTRHIMVYRDGFRAVYTARIPDMARGYRDYEYMDDKDRADDHVKRWNDANLRIGGYGG